MEEGLAFPRRSSVLKGLCMQWLNALGPEHKGSLRIKIKKWKMRLARKGLREALQKKAPGIRVHASRFLYQKVRWA